MTSSGPRTRPLAALCARVSMPTRLALLLLSLHLLVRAWLVLPGAYWQDDFVFLHRARTEPLTLDFVLHAHNGHVIPLPFLFSWLVGQTSSYLPTALLIMVLQAFASFSLWLLLRRAAGNSPAMLVGLAAALFTPLMLSTVTWWAAGAMMLGLQTSMALAGYAHLEFLRTRSWRWLTAVLAAFLLGFAFWEKAVLLPVFLGLLTIVTSGTGARMWRTVLRAWPAWLAYVVVTGSYLIAYSQVASVGEAQVRDIHGLLSLIRHQVVDVFFRGLIGGPWHAVQGDTASWVTTSAFGLAVLVQLAALLTLVAHRISGAVSWVCWAVILVYLGFDIALTARGRGLYYAFVQMDPRYVCDVIPLAGVCVALMLTPRPGRRVRLPDWAIARPWLGALAVVVLLFNSGMVTASAMAPALHRDEVKAYVANARTSLGKDPHLVLYDGFVPAPIMIGAFPPDEKRVSSVLAAYGVHPRFDRPSERLRVLDETGVARPIILSFVQTGRINSGDDCGTLLDRSQSQQVIDLDNEIPVGRWVLALDYYAGADAVVDVVTAGDRQPVGLAAGRHTVYVPVEGGTSSVEVLMRSGDSAVCVTGLTVGYPVPRTP
jgi:hypothetical protein